MNEIVNRFVPFRRHYSDIPSVGIWLILKLLDEDENLYDLIINFIFIFIFRFFLLLLLIILIFNFLNINKF